MNKMYNVLFLCSQNSARSLMAEALLNVWGKGRFVAYSAGSNPAGTVNPYAERLLQSLNLDTSTLRSKSWDEYAAEASPVMDFIFVVGDTLVPDHLPDWPGKPMIAHWEVDDPVGLAPEGDDLAQMNAFRLAFRQLEHRVKIFAALRLDALSEMAMQTRLSEIGLETV
jgi:protein-tyrosine-phosphatase